MPKPLRRLIAAAIGLVPPLLERSLTITAGRGLQLTKKTRKLAEALSLDDVDAQNRQRLSRWDNPIALVAGAEREPPGILWDETLADELPDIVSRMQFLDTVTSLPEGILAKVDRASMAVSLEVRVPILDHRLVEFVWSLPRHMKIREGKSKWLLRQLLYRYLPRDLVERPKMGFGVPLDGWLRGPLREWAEGLLSERSLREAGLLDPKPIRKKWNEHVSGIYNWKKQVWNVLMLQAWHKHWVQRKPC